MLLFLDRSNGVFTVQVTAYLWHVQVDHYENEMYRTVLTVCTAH